MTSVQRVAFAAVVIAASACSSSYRGGAVEGELNRAEIMRCGVEPASSVTEAGVEGLAGRYHLFMIADGDAMEVVSGTLALDAADESGEGMGLAPTLVGAASIDPAPLGASVPGDASSTDPGAPGVGVYVYAESADAPDDLTGLVRLGEEANRRDRQRFDGAHTTLRINSLGADRFGGTWSSAEGADGATGHFCGLRIGAN